MTPADNGEMNVLPLFTQGGKAVDERRIPFPRGQTADGKEQAVPFRNLQGGAQGADFLAPLRTRVEHLRVDAPMDDLAVPIFRRAIRVHEFLPAEGRDGDARALLECGLFVACVGLGREQNGEVVRVRNGGGLSASPGHEQAFSLTDP